MTDAITGGPAGNQSRRVKRAEDTEIYGTPPRGDDMAFTHAVFCQVGLPRSKVEGREFMRQSGAAWINVQAGYLGSGPIKGYH